MIRFEFSYKLTQVERNKRNKARIPEFVSPPCEIMLPTAGAWSMAMIRSIETEKFPNSEV